MRTSKGCDAPENAPGTDPGQGVVVNHANGASSATTHGCSHSLDVERRGADPTLGAGVNKLSPRATGLLLSLPVVVGLVLWLFG
jgi:hypothetical protein